MKNLPTLMFGKRRVAADAPVLIIAEIGINHEGDAELCARMIEEAVTAGADAVKLQTIDPDRNYEPGSESHQLFSSAMLSREATARMFSLTRDLGAEPFTTVGDFATLEWVTKLSPSGYKISSGLLTCLPIIARAATMGAPLLMSTGVAQPQDIDSAMATARKAHAKGIVLLQCTSLYPAPLTRLDLANINWLAQRYDVFAGFSDHSIGTQAAALAVAAGAVVIEKHFSLDPARPSYDHSISLDPHDFRRMVEGIREAEAARGRAGKKISPDIRAKRDAIGRSLAVIMPVAAGERLTELNIGFLRNGGARDVLPPSAFDEILGAKATRDLKAFSYLTPSCFRRD